MVSERLSSTGAPDIFSIGLDRSPAMLRAQRHNGFAYPGASRLVGAVETLPFYDASCDAITSFNAVHHFDLATFASEAARVLSPSGFLVLYTRTAEQNRNTIWGRFFPEFATLETRLHSASELQEALDATHAFVSVRVQMIPWRVTTSLSRLLEQVTAYHYSTFRFYSPDRLRAARDTFQCRLRDVFGDCSRITFSNDHLLVVAQRAGRSANRQNVVRPLDYAGRLAINGQIFGRHDATGDDHG
jgi:SAM-dependent methyltransferase